MQRTHVTQKGWHDGCGQRPTLNGLTRVRVARAGHRLMHELAGWRDLVERKGIGVLVLGSEVDKTCDSYKMAHQLAPALGA